MQILYIFHYFLKKSLIKNRYNFNFLVTLQHIMTLYFQGNAFILEEADIQLPFSVQIMQLIQINDLIK